jgi:hypothetical protein
MNPQSPYCAEFGDVKKDTGILCGPYYFHLHGEIRAIYLLMGTENGNKKWQKMHV